MIQFLSVTKILVRDGKPPQLILHRATGNIPSSKSIEVQSDAPAITTAFLHLIGGATKPDRGRIIRNGRRLSPVLNQAGNPVLVVPQLTVLENIRHQARLSHMNVAQMTDFVLSSSECEPASHSKVSTLNWRMRRALEIAIFTALPFDCYVVDAIDNLPDIARMQIYYATRKRNAGLIFSAVKQDIAKEFREATMALKNGTIAFQELAEIRN